MKKAVFRLLILSYAVFFIAMLVMGMKIADHDYAYRTEAVITLAALIVNTACHMARLFSNRCPHCGRLRLVSGAHCAHCGEPIEQ